jgi:hypothetical protein
MSKKTENTGFVCEFCHREVEPVTNGSYRNHCPYCLYSKHVDFEPGDRQNPCGGLMKPISIRYHTQKGYQIRHKCSICGIEQWNKAAQDTVDPDNLELLLKLMQAS